MHVVYMVSLRQVRLVRGVTQGVSRVNPCGLSGSFRILAASLQAPSTVLVYHAFCGYVKRFTSVLVHR